MPVLDNKTFLAAVREYFTVKFSLKRFLANTGKMTAILLAAIVLTEILHSYNIGRQSIVAVYLLSVLIISRVMPFYLYGFTAAVLATFACDYFASNPRMVFSFESGSPITLLTMLAAAFFMSTITVQMQKQTDLATNREQRAQLLYEINRELLAARSTDAIVSITNDYLTENLNCPVIFYTGDPCLGESVCYAQKPDSDESAAIFHTPEEHARVSEIFARNAQEFLLDTACPVHYVPVVSKEKTLGVIGFYSREAVSGHTGTLLQILTGQVAFALEIQILSDRQSHMRIDAEKEKMRSTLLRSISHDLRTPLTSMLGASSTILEQDALDEKTVKTLVADIKENTQWLIRMVENILLITKISGADLQVTKTPEAAEEVVAHAVAIVRRRFPDYYYHVDIPDEFLLVPMDAMLISQVLINLMENAVKSAPKGSLILVNLKKNGAFAQFSVIDNGRGIPPRILENLFDIHDPRSEPAVDGARGMGMGLSICKTIIKAHDGSIAGGNRAGGGARFSFKLPMEEAEHVEQQ